VLALAAERTVKRVLRVATAGFTHRHSVVTRNALPASAAFFSLARGQAL
jgi:hypothetical protein